MADTRDFLLEIGTEEMPSAPLMNAQRQLSKLVAAKLDEAGLAHGEVRTFSSPRRLAVIVSDVADSTAEVNEVKQGPAASIAFDAAGAPTKAAEGFARKMGLAADQLVRREGSDGREHVFAELHVDSKPALPILSEISEATIGDLQWPNYRSQRWGSEHATFVRPIRWICCLFGSEVVPVTYADVTSSNTTRGHRVLGPGEHVVSEPGAYEGVLEEAHVLTERRRDEVIRQGIARIEQEMEGCHVETPKGTYEEVVNLCEWPTVLVGEFDEEFLKVPHEIICDSMLSNQRYFPIYDKDGKLTRKFVIVSNADPRCNDTVIAGNERVVRPRLDDAKFFYEEDLKVPMDEFVERLGKVAFQEKLGTMLQKAHRMEALAPEVCSEAGDAAEAKLAARAALLAKADLVSQAVVEFTNQQGVMGGYYAAAAGEPEVVSRAITEHYRPRFAGDELPSGTVGKAVAIADKLDTICGLFAIDEPPTGSSDPFAVRRSAIGVIAMLRTLEGVDLKGLIARALGSYAEQGLEFDGERVAADVESFFVGRLASIAKDEGVSPDTIEAVSSVGVIDPTQFLARAHALEDARAGESEVFDDLATAFARASHLTDASLGEDVDEAALTEPERALLEACEAGARKVSSTIAESDFTGACAALADLREPIDQFFDDVLVMDDDTKVRENRLRLLNKFVGVFRDVADFAVLSRK
jgi:glycyl-tRNA synthetase beta chain